jgi:hypothetical protein
MHYNPPMYKKIFALILLVPMLSFASANDVKKFLLSDSCSEKVRADAGIQAEIFTGSVISKITKDSRTETRGYSVLTAQIVTIEDAYVVLERVDGSFETIKVSCRKY